MKRKRKLLDAFSYADDAYIAEADPAVAAPKRKTWRTFAIVAACACFAIVCASLWLFTPISTRPNIEGYRDSEYFAVIEKLENYYGAQTKKTNRFEQYFDGLFDSVGMNGSSDMAGSAENITNGQKYEEVTDNQTQGVTEGDLIKRSDRYIYYLNGSTLSVYSIAGDASEKISSFNLKGTELLKNSSVYYGAYEEMYLSEDCRTVTVLSPNYDKQGKANVIVTALDVTDPAAITLKSQVRISGSYITSRITENGILLFSHFAVRSNCDYSDESTFLPQIDRGGNVQSIAPDAIYMPDVLSGTAYTVVVQLDEADLSMTASAAFLSYSQEVYVSEGNIFTTRSYSERKELDGGYVEIAAMSEIAVMAYGADGFSHRGSFSLEGFLKNRYSLSEYNGILRAVTTTSTSRYREERNEDWTNADASISATMMGSGTNANLYCVSLTDLSVVSSVLSFAPEGESVQSVRFDGNAAYVCTSLVLKDPVFYFDLTDIYNITYKDTGTIDGYSSSLIQLGDGYLLGFGYGDSFSGFKAEVYFGEDEKVVSVDKYEISNVYFSEDYKSYYVDRENMLFGLGVTRYSSTKYGESSYYVLLHFDGYRLREVLFETLDGDNSIKRGVYVDGWFYMFGTNDFAVEKIF